MNSSPSPLDVLETQASSVRSRKSPGGVLHLLDFARPGGFYPIPASDDLVLHQELLGGVRVHGESGGGPFDSRTEGGDFFLAAPNHEHAVSIDRPHRNRTLAFPMAQWRDMVAEASDGQSSVETLRLYRGAFRSPRIQAALRILWALCDDEGTPSRLLVRAAGCEVLADLFRQSGAAFAPAKGGLSAGAQRRCIELMRARLADDISLDDIAAEARLSVFHFARMFKQSLGVSPRVYLSRLRIEKACELLEQTNRSITDIALEVGYTSNQVLARVFVKHQRMSPVEYRRKFREATSPDPTL